jgi:hypothetical protein
MNNTQYGPTDPDATDGTPLGVFKLFFQDELLHQLVESTNTYAEENEIGYSPGYILQVDAQDILNYLAIFFIMGIYPTANRRMYWESPSQNYGWAEYQGITSIMGYTKWECIHRCLQVFMKKKKTNNRITNKVIIHLLDKFFFFIILQINLVTLRDYVNQVSKENWNPYPDLCIDDDLDRWKGRGRKKYLKKKADRTGIASWKCVDSRSYCYHMEFEWHCNKDTCQDSISKGDLPFGQAMLQHMEQQLPSDEPYLLTIDAGNLGSVQNALYLQEHGRRYLISVAKNRGKYLWDGLHKGTIFFVQFDFPFSPSS